MAYAVVNLTTIQSKPRRPSILVINYIYMYLHDVAKQHY